jgi:hypothetical protein
MAGQMIDMEALDLQIERKVKRYQQKYNITNADIAWIFLRIGTSFYFKDISSRGLYESEQANHNGYTVNMQGR